jgi:citrate lyase gamma subunit
MPNRPGKFVVKKLNPAEILVQEYRDLGAGTRMCLARGLHKAAKKIEVMDGDDIIEKAEKIKSVVGSVASVHAWAADVVPTKIALTVTGANVQIEDEGAVDCEWSDAI